MNKDMIMDKARKYESPEVRVMAWEAESAFLSNSLAGPVQESGVEVDGFQREQPLW